MGRIEELVLKLYTPEGRDEFVNTHWRDIAAFAWERYTVKGRGAVALNMVEAESLSPIMPAIEMPVAYYTPSDINPSDEGNGRLLREIQEYEPEKEIVLCMMDSEHDGWASRVKSNVTPPRAYKLLRKKQESDPTVT